MELMFELMFESLSDIFRNLSDSKTYNLAPPIGPPTVYPILSSEELQKIQESLFGRANGNEYAYDRLKMIEHPKCPIVRELIPKELDGMNIWSIDGSNQTLDFSAFQTLLSRASIIEYRYSLEPLSQYHLIKTLDCSGVCIVDGNIFQDGIYLYGQSTAHLNDLSEISWMDVIDGSDSPLIVSYNPHDNDVNPSSHASGWNIKFMQTLELLALRKIPNDQSGVVIRDGGMYPICATVIDTKKAILETLNWNNKIVISCSKRIDESTLFLELLTNNSAESSLLEYYFPEQSISTKHVNKLPADAILLRKILQPGERTPFVEAVPRSRKAICEGNDDLIPVCSYYMRKRAPNSIIRMEFPKYYLEKPDQLDMAIRVVAWQHEIGVKVPQIQESADKHCQIKSESQLLRKIIASELATKGLETLEVYE